jgi:hypothetical protein
LNGKSRRAAALSTFQCLGDMRAAVTPKPMKNSLARIKLFDAVNSMVYGNSASSQQSARGIWETALPKLEYIRRFFVYNGGV